MNFSFSRILYFIRTLISTIKIPRIKLQKISSTAVTFLEYWKRKNASLAHHWDCMGFQVKFTNKHKFQFSLFQFSNRLIFYSGRRRASKTRVCGESSVPGEKPDHRRAGARVPKGSQVLIAYN